VSLIGVEEVEPKVNSGFWPRRASGGANRRYLAFAFLPRAAERKAKGPVIGPLDRGVLAWNGVTKTVALGGWKPNEDARRSTLCRVSDADPARGQITRRPKINIILTDLELVRGRTGELISIPSRAGLRSADRLGIIQCAGLAKVV
jgi:hypothetical protein